MLHRNDNMLLRIAQADAFGAAYEYVDDAEAPGFKQRMLAFDRYLQHPTYHKLHAGKFTDDTQMSIAVTTALIETSPLRSFFRSDPCVDLNTDLFMKHFFDTFKADPRDGYSRNFQRILEESSTVEELKQKLIPDSTANGAAMRAVPIGVIGDPEEVARVAGVQAITTHCTWGGTNSATLVALMSHFALYEARDFSELIEWGNQYCPTFEHLREPWVGRVKAYDVPGDMGVGMHTAHAVHTLLVQCRSLKDIMRQVIEWGGDTDSVASIAWGIASSRYRDEALPGFLEDDLEFGTSGGYGSTFLKKLGTRLMDNYDADG